MSNINDRRAELLKKREELQKLDAKYGSSLAKLPHPRGFSGRSLRDSVNYALSTGGITSVVETIRSIKKHEANRDLEIPSATDGYVVAYGKTYGLNEKFQSYGFSLKKFGAVWAWYRETLSDKIGVWDGTVKSFGPEIEMIFVREFDFIIVALSESKEMDKELKKSTPREELESHELNGSVFEVKKWYAQQFKQNNNTAYAFRNLRILKVKQESAKAYLVDAEFFSGIASSCGCCGLELNNDISRATGIGPICAKKIGLPRPTMATAKLIVAELESLSKAQGIFYDVWIPRSQIKNIVK